MMVEEILAASEGLEMVFESPHGPGPLWAVWCDAAGWAGAWLPELFSRWTPGNGADVGAMVEHGLKFLGAVKKHYVPIAPPIYENSEGLWVLCWRSSVDTLLWGSVYEGNWTYTFQIAPDHGEREGAAIAALSRLIRDGDSDAAKVIITRPPERLPWAEWLKVRAAAERTGLHPAEILAAIEQRDTQRIPGWD